MRNDDSPNPIIHRHWDRKLGMFKWTVTASEWLMGGWSTPVATSRNKMIKAIEFVRRLNGNM